jgi:hypothetical protein
LSILGILVFFIWTILVLFFWVGFEENGFWEFDYICWIFELLVIFGIGLIWRWGFFGFWDDGGENYWGWIRLIYDGIEAK